ncbi:MAG: hypothetical protein ACR2NO_12575 [Chloroflexota bacterium]
MTWLIAVGGPLLGIAAVVALVVAHEHGTQLRRARLPLGVRLPETPRVVRRANTALLDDYLVEDRDAGTSLRRQRHTRLLIQASRSNTWVLAEYLEEREKDAPPTAAPAAAPKIRSAAAPAPVPAPARARHVEERSARPTRLVPLSAVTSSAEIAIG